MTRGLCGQWIHVHHTSDSTKMLAFHRWDRGGPRDDTVVVANFSHRAHHDEIGLTLGVQQTYRGVAAVLGPFYAGAAYEKLGQHVPFFISAGIIMFVLYLTLRVREESQPQVAVET